ncbi:MAG: MltA domain-containing protein [Desulfobacterales bacterium]|nr:MltA domain-containing protein [Desulfobacterales bacterium]
MRSKPVEISLLTLFLILICLFTGCDFNGQKPAETPKPSLVKLSPGQYPAFLDGFDYKGLIPAMEQSLAYYRRVPPKRRYSFGGDVYTAEHMIRSLEVLTTYLERNPSTRALDNFIRDQYLVYASGFNQDPGVLFTGYYEPTYWGSRADDERFSHPLYSLPSDLIQVDLSRFGEKYKGLGKIRGRVKENQVVPYFTRAEINANPAFQGEPVLWLENRVDRFFLEVQGSGRIQTPEGEILRVHYAGSNGQAYRSIGRYLIEQGEIPKEKMSMQAIRDWLEANPGRMDEILHHNPSFVFFKTEEGGPYGCLNVALTPVRSIATDPKAFPRGALAFMRTALPDARDLWDRGDGSLDGPKREDWPRISLFVMNQDTGGAIKGPGRADIFCGNGGWAEFTAGHMNIRGSLYFLVLKP